MNAITLRLTADNVTRELHCGDMFVGEEEFGPVVHVRLTRDGFDNARVTTDRDTDILGLPQTVTVYREES